jgi:hypothetical protein
MCLIIVVIILIEFLFRLMPILHNLIVVFNEFITFTLLKDQY